MYGYVYLTTNLINNKLYIGQHRYSKPVIDRSYLGSGYVLRNAIKKYGKENFKCEILEFIETKQDANEREKFWIAYYRENFPGMVYNINGGGEGADYTRYSAEWKKEHLGHATKERQKYYHKKRPREHIEKTIATKAKQVHCNNGSECKVFFRDEIPEGWVIGQLLASKEEYARRAAKGALLKKGRKYYTNGETDITCKPGEEPLGFHLGRTHIVRMNAGKICINNGKHQKYINPKDPLPEGYSYGGVAREVKPTVQGRRWVNNGTEEKYLKPEEGIPDGWKSGRIFHRRSSTKSERSPTAALADKMD